MQTGAVTFLDVLGWKGIWTRDDAAIAKLKALISAARDAVPSVLAAGAEHVAELRGFDESQIQVESISDTIVLFTPEVAGATPTLWLHGALCQVIICASLDGKIPVRGATCYGEYAADDRIMVGPAIDEAASWHESTDWIGVIQTPTAYLVYGETVGLPRVWVPYPPPLKSGRLDRAFCVDWCSHWRDALHRDEHQLKNLFTQMAPLDTSIAGKYLNALTFYQKCQPDPAVAPA